MDPNATSLALWSYGLAAFGYLAQLIYLMQQPFGRQPGRAGRALLLALAATWLWSLSGIFFAVSDSPWAFHFYLATDILRYGAWYLCLILMLMPSGEALSLGTLRRHPLALTAAAIVSLAMVFQLLTMRGGTVVTPLSLQLTQLSNLAMVVCGLVLIEQLLRNASSDTRWNFKPMWLGLLGIFVFDIYLYSDRLLFNRMDADLFAIRGFIVSMILPLVALSIARNKGRALRLALSQSAVFHSTTLVVVGAYLLFVAAAGYYVRYFGGEWGRALQFVVFFAAMLALALLAFSASMRAKLRVWIGKHFFRYRYDYRQEWLKFTTALSAEGAPQEVGQRVIHGLADMVESPAGALWLRDATGARYLQAARWNIPEVSEPVPGDSAVVRFLRESGWVLNMEEYRHMPARYGGLALPGWLTTLSNIWLIVPLTTGKDLVGFVVLTTARTELDVDWEVNDLLKTAGRQAASYIAQMQATEALLEASKFDSFNRMSAFVVHDLKNIITQLSLMVKNAERHRDNPEFQQDMLLTVQHSVERMRQLMLQLRAGATPVAGTFGVNLAEIIRHIQASKAAQQPGLTLNLQDGVVARGHEERIERVIGHVVQNALDATPAEGSVTVELKVEEGMALVQVADTGAGMSPEFLRDRLFKPFQTTKDAGMGIGAYESFQYVQELGGRIAVDSEIDVGTCVKMYFPLFEIRNESDMQRLEMA